jgi:hypothetical protein
MVPAFISKFPAFSRTPNCDKRRQTASPFFIEMVPAFLSKSPPFLERTPTHFWSCLLARQFISRLFTLHFLFALFSHLLQYNIRNCSTQEDARPQRPADKGVYHFTDFIFNRFSIRHHASTSTLTFPPSVERTHLETVCLSRSASCTLVWQRIFISPCVEELYCCC